MTTEIIDLNEKLNNFKEDLKTITNLSFTQFIKFDNFKLFLKI